MTVHKKPDSVSSLVPKPAPKITIPKTTPQPSSPNLKGLLATGQVQGKTIQTMVKPNGLLNKMAKTAVKQQKEAKAMASAPPMKIGAPLKMGAPPSAKAPSANLQALLKQGQQQGKQIQGLPKK